MSEVPSNKEQKWGAEGFLPAGVADFAWLVGRDRSASLAFWWLGVGGVGEVLPQVSGIGPADLGGFSIGSFDPLDGEVV